jgi:iron(III) transport system ATP-binding protein
VWRNEPPAAQLGITAVYVTHDRREAELLADQIVIYPRAALPPSAPLLQPQGKLHEHRYDR